ncbi:MAG: 7-cyano-7-deazaguanine synthase QueC [Acholeplasmatales bacterium]|nr:7-cyano-7-deazaguanine synthase QueC [Acholeplasmatales bacterium]
MSRALVLFSGGLDSTTALAMAINKYGKDNVVALSVSYGQKHVKEIEASNKIASYYGVEHIFLDLAKIFAYSNCSLLSQNADIDVPEGDYSKQLQELNGGTLSTYVPFRNGLFLSSAASIALSKNCDIIYYGAHADDAAGEAYPDCSPEFTKAINDAIYLGSGKKVSVVGPFVNMHKADIVKIGLDLKVPYELTWSCYEGHDKACGRCGTCIDRIKAFEANGVKDPIEYEEK